MPFFHRTGDMERSTWSVYVIPRDNGDVEVFRWLPPGVFTEVKRLTVESPEYVKPPLGKMTHLDLDAYLSQLPIGSKRTWA
jgi:hypothetical protein